jgi:winged helix DNA-binding protein
MAVKLTWPQVLAWRMERSFLDPLCSASVTEVVRRLCGVQSQVASSADLAIRLRLESSQPDDVTDAIADGRLIKTWAMRATLHLLPAADAPTFLSLTSADELWEDWQRYLGMTEAEMAALREAMLNALQGEPLTKAELGAAVVAKLGPGPAAEALKSSWGGLLTPLAWAGDLCCGPSQGTRVTFTTPARASRHWPGKVDAEEAVPRAITAYVRTYGPTTVDSLSRWLASATSKRKIRTWFGALHDRMTEVEVDGEPAHVMTDDLDALVAARPTAAVRLLAGFDQYVLGPGTKDGHVVPPARRAAVSRQAGWISPVVVAGGRVSGTWELKGPDVQIAWFGEAGRPPKRALQTEVTRLSSVLDRDLRSVVTLA